MDVTDRRAADREVPMHEDRGWTLTYDSARLPDTWHATKGEQELGAESYPALKDLIDSAEGAVR